VHLIDAVEARLHRRNRAVVHARYEPGRCPHCSFDDRLAAMIRAKVAKIRVSSPKAVEPS
jgi:glutaredoxin